MCVTITIRNNERYTRESYPHLIQREYLDPSSSVDQPWLLDYPQGYIEHFPFELRLSLVNFRALWGSLGFDTYDCGSIDSEILVHEISRKFSVQKLVSNGGYTKEIVAGYYWHLNVIAREARARKELVTWG